jgi:hypothetical protein
LLKIFSTALLLEKNKMGETPVLRGLMSRKPSWNSCHERFDRSIGEFLLYETEDGKSVEFRFLDDTLWLTQALMAELFQVKVGEFTFQPHQA